jgi:hypothetical protein
MSDQSKLRPIPGAPPYAPNPPFPSGPVGERVQPSDSIKGRNEIAVLAPWLARAKYGAKIALEAWCEIAKLLVIMHDVHGYQGKRYVAFAKARDIKRGDAYAL